MGAVIPWNWTGAVARGLGMGNIQPVGTEQGVCLCITGSAALKSCCIFIKSLDSVDKTDLGCHVYCSVCQKRETASI